MRTLIFISLFCLLASCRSQKEVQKDVSLALDSVAHGESHRTIVQIDSIIRSARLDFDTLEVVVERPVAEATAPEVIRLKAVRGSVTDSRQQQSMALEHYNRLDTVAYKVSSADRSTEHTATTRVYNPPNGTAAVIVTIIVIGCLVCVFYRKR